MANQKKTVQFDHFRPYYLAQDEHGVPQEHLYDLRALLEHVTSRPFPETKKKNSRRYTYVPHMSPR